MSKLVCKDLTKNYGQKTVLNHLNLSLESGKIYGLIGRNGAGKTTLLSLMTAQNPATGGTCLLDGEPIWENRSSLDRLCFSRELNISTENGLASYTVKRYLQVAAAYYAHWDAALADALVQKFQLNPKSKLSKLSKGMLSMVTIIVALASKAEFTFLDEPVAGLDVVAREEFYRLLLDEYSDTGRTFVISTHIIEEAADLIEEVLILDNGRILVQENTQSLLERAKYITGATDQVDGAILGLPCCHQETIGRSKSATLLLEDGQNLNPGFDITVQSLSLQKLFVALCSEEASQ